MVDRDGDHASISGGLTNPPLEGIQTVTAAPGGAVITEFKLHVPGNYTIVVEVTPIPRSTTAR
jgi:hypothetical protein